MSTDYPLTPRFALFLFGTSIPPPDDLVAFNEKAKKARQTIAQESKAVVASSPSVSGSPPKLKVIVPKPRQQVICKDQSVQTSPFIFPAPSNVTSSPASFQISVQNVVTQAPQLEQCILGFPISHLQKLSDSAVLQRPNELCLVAHSAHVGYPLIQCIKQKQQDIEWQYSFLPSVLCLNRKTSHFVVGREGDFAGYEGSETTTDNPQSEGRGSPISAALLIAMNAKTIDVAQKEKQKLSAAMSSDPAELPTDLYFCIKNEKDVVMTLTTNYLTIQTAESAIKTNIEDIVKTIHGIGKNGERYAAAASVYFQQADLETMVFPVIKKKDDQYETLSLPCNTILPIDYEFMKTLPTWDDTTNKRNLHLFKRSFYRIVSWQNDFETKNIVALMHKRKIPTSSKTKKIGNVIITFESEGGFIHSSAIPVSAKKSHVEPNSWLYLPTFSDVVAFLQNPERVLGLSHIAFLSHAAMKNTLFELYKNNSYIAQHVELAVEPAPTESGFMQIPQMSIDLIEKACKLLVNKSRVMTTAPNQKAIDARILAMPPLVHTSPLKLVEQNETSDTMPAASQMPDDSRPEESTTLNDFIAQVNELLLKTPIVPK